MWGWVGLYGRPPWFAWTPFALDPCRHSWQQNFSCNLQPSHDWPKFECQHCSSLVNATSPASSKQPKQLTVEIPQAQLIVIPGAAHLVNMEQPEEFNKVALDFL